MCHPDLGGPSGRHYHASTFFWKRHQGRKWKRRREPQDYLHDKDVGRRWNRTRGRKRTGATPKGHGRPWRPKTAGGRQTPFLAWRPRKAAWEVTQLVQDFSKAWKKNKGMKVAGETPKGHGRPVRPRTAGGPPQAISDRKTSRETQELKKIGWMLGKHG